MPPTAVSLLVVFSALTIYSGLHEIDEGHIGVYWRGGALLGRISEPGYRWKIPFLDTVAQVDVSVQTDKVVDIPCGTSGGVLINFDKIEVVNRLNKSHALDTIRKYSLNYDKIWIFDKIHHEINQFCSSHTLQEVYIDKFDTLDESLSQALQRDCDKWAPGISIIATRVTKPRIPRNIERDYEQMEAEKTKLLIETQRQRVTEKEAETEQLVAVIQASKQAEVSRIQMELAILEKQTQQRIATIETEINTATQNAKSDATFYRASRLAAANTLKYTPAYLQYRLYDELRKRPKVFYGSNLTSLYDFNPSYENLPFTSLSATSLSESIQFALQRFATVSETSKPTGSIPGPIISEQLPDGDALP